MDISARPLTIDFEGPEGEVFVRQAMVRWTQPLSPNWIVAIAAENPTPQFTIPAGVSGAAQSRVPDIPGFVRYQRARGHVQVAGLIRQLRFVGASDTPDDSTVGGGVNATFAVKTSGRDVIQGQFMIGNGVGRYIAALTGQNVDALLSDDGRITSLRSQGGLLAYTRHWSPRVKSGLASWTTRSRSSRCG